MPYTSVPRSDPARAANRPHGPAGHEPYAVRVVQVDEDLGHLWSEHPLQGQRRHLDDGHVRLGDARRGGDLEPDPAASDHHDPGAIDEAWRQPLRVGERAQVEHPVEVGAGYRQPTRRVRPRRATV